MLPTNVRWTRVRNFYRNSKKKNKPESKKLSFYEFVRPVLLSCKLMGFLPLNGLVNTKDSGKRHTLITISRYNWMSLYTCFYLANVIWMTFCSLAKCIDKLAFGLGRKDISGIIFSMNTLFSSLFLMKLTPKWYETFQRIEELENVLPNPKTLKPLRTIKRILFIIVTSALVEFAMYLVYTAYESIKGIKNVGFDYCFERFFVYAYDWYFDHFSFKCLIGIMLAASKCQATCLRNLTDILVMSVTVYLCARFSCFNRQLIQEEKKAKYTGFMPWSDLQKHYTQLTSLTLLLDEIINPFIFISFSCNLIFICKQIFSVIQFVLSQQEMNLLMTNTELQPLNRKLDWEPVVYLVFSTVFVIMRATMLSLFLAHHHTLTRAPLDILHTLPASAYNYKTQRFMDQVFNSRLSLSGLKFFYVTRESILSVVATLVKYELVLLQFPERG
nr:gustatory receptor 11 [Papilio polytes]